MVAGMDGMVSLVTAPLGVPMTLVTCVLDSALRGRLSILGLRPGAHVEVLHATPGGGRVVAVAGSRVALDRNVLKSLTARLAA